MCADKVVDAAVVVVAAAVDVVVVVVFVVVLIFDTMEDFATIQISELSYSS